MERRIMIIESKGKYSKTSFPEFSVGCGFTRKATNKVVTKKKNIAVANNLE